MFRPVLAALSVNELIHAPIDRSSVNDRSTSIIRYQGRLILEIQLCMFARLEFAIITVFLLLVLYSIHCRHLVPALKAWAAWA